MVPVEICMREMITERDPRKVFIVHGRNTLARDAIVLFLRALKLDALDFDEVRNELRGSPFVGDVVRLGMERAQGIVVVFTPDEYACLHPTLVDTHDAVVERERWQARPNVLLEAGMALGIDEHRTILVVLGDVSLASDLYGRHFVRLNNSVPARERLKYALQGVGCIVGKETPGWHDTRIAGDFDAAISSPALPEVSAKSPFR